MCRILAADDAAPGLRAVASIAVPQSPESPNVRHSCSLTRSLVFRPQCAWFFWCLLFLGGAGLLVAGGVHGYMQEDSLGLNTWESSKVRRCEIGVR